MRSYLGYLIIAIAIIISAILAASTLKYRFKSGETITVTGLAEKDFIADQIVWKGSFTRTGMDLKTAYAALKAVECDFSFLL